MNDLRPEKILQRWKQSGGCFFDDRLAGQGNDPSKICSWAGKTRFDHQPLGAVGETNQRSLIGNRDFGWIGRGGITMPSASAATGRNRRSKNEKIRCTLAGGLSLSSGKANQIYNRGAANQIAPEGWRSPRRLRALWKSLEFPSGFGVRRPSAAFPTADRIGINPVARPARISHGRAWIATQRDAVGAPATRSPELFA